MNNSRYYNFKKFIILINGNFVKKFALKLYMALRKIKMVITKQ